MGHLLRIASGGSLHDILISALAHELDGSHYLTAKHAIHTLVDLPVLIVHHFYVAGLRHGRVNCPLSTFSSNIFGSPLFVRRPCSHQSAKCKLSVRASSSDSSSEVPFYQDFQHRQAPAQQEQHASTSGRTADGADSRRAPAGRSFKLSPFSFRASPMAAMGLPDLDRRKEGEQSSGGGENAASPGGNLEQGTYSQGDELLDENEFDFDGDMQLGQPRSQDDLLTTELTKELLGDDEAEEWKDTKFDERPDNRLRRFVVERQAEEGMARREKAAPEGGFGSQRFGAFDFTVTLRTSNEGEMQHS